MRYLFAVLALGCEPVELPEWNPASEVVTAAEVRTAFGEPCTVEHVSRHVDRWTYCVARCDIAEWCRATCAPDCSPRWSYDMVGDIMVSQVKPD